MVKDKSYFEESKFGKNEPTKLYTSKFPSQKEDEYL